MELTYEMFTGINTLNIFSDASILKPTKDRPYFIGCPGVVIYLGSYPCGRIYDIIPETTNNFCEMRAIGIAVTMANWYRQYYHIDRINIFSDSKISVYGLREWIYSWVRNAHNGELISSSGSVKNQTEILKIIQYIIQNNLRINLYHVRGHHDHNTDKEFREFVESFKRENHITNILDGVLIKELIQGNSMVDNMTRDALKGLDINQTIQNKPKPVFDYDYAKIIQALDMNKYRDLISGGNLR